MRVFDYSDLTFQILDHIYHLQDESFLYSCFDESTSGFSPYLDHVCYKNDILLQINKLKKTHISYQLDQYHCHIIEKNESMCLVEGEYLLHLEQFKQETKHFYTILYKIHDDQIKIKHIHTSFSMRHQSIQDTNTNEYLNIVSSCKFNYDENLTIKEMNSCFVDMLGYHDHDELLTTCQHHFIELIHPDDVKSFKEVLQQATMSHHRLQNEYRLRKKNGDYIWVIEQGQIILDSSLQIIFDMLISDVNSIKQNELDLLVQKEKYQMILKDNSIAILEYRIDDDQMIIDIQEEDKKKIYNHYLDYIQSSRSTVFDEDKPALISLFTRKIPGPIIIREHMRGNKHYFIKRIDSHIIYDNLNRPIIVLATAKNITEEWQQNNVLKQKAERDPLTHLYNLETGSMKIEDYLSIKDPDETYAFIVFDVDHFKGVNDTYGHLFGNQVLISISQYFIDLKKKDDIIIRMGGDEFVVFFSHVNPSKVNELCQHINEGIKNISYPQTDYHATISMGCFYSQEKYSYTQIFKAADNVLYKAKKKGRDCYTVTNHIL
ncbi:MULTISPECIES: sensor domain-containing diguanylate cyclase [Coprobacillaceae]|uniref:sensor domain-containing diguanylate cyclase n=1 Tax=Coprobacillaceae TaxID=2810280 RepID=UPI000E500EC3|nr:MULTISPECIES: sensor domain-containing diguanylate cyclase [Coprobacillaceae]RHM62857.1 diguanylate cyclase [Coprobacillus sp. AF33-1AC]RHS95002.1 diguanylate cyclase [Erysipelatoclostridium sp. AM42-17]